MELREHDQSKAWRLRPHAVPPTVAELERRINEALATARASEAAVMTVGAAALDAAEQAKRAADLAERASAGLLAPQAGDPELRDFSAHADRVSARLRELEKPTLATAG